jgi:methionyl aminopeptidase
VISSVGVGLSVGVIVPNGFNFNVGNLISDNVGVAVGINLKLVPNLMVDDVGVAVGINLKFPGSSAFASLIPITNNSNIPITNPAGFVYFTALFYTPIAKNVKKYDNPLVVIIKTSKQIGEIRRSCILAAQTLKYLSGFIKPGVTTESLNQLAHDFILDYHAIPAPLNYGGFPKSICTSVNNVVCHGIPSDKVILQEGDIVNLDITTILNGYYGDTSATYPVGKISPQAKLLIKTTKTSLDMAIKSLKPGKSLNECVGRVIEKYVSGFGFTPIRELGGHGVGLKFHEDPFVFHHTTPQSDVILKPGMIFTIEPMINASLDWRVTVDVKDGWTVRTYDSSLSCQFEHTVLITPKGSEVLTKI